MGTRSCTPPFVVALSLLALVVAQLACGQPAQEWELRGWTVTPSQSEATQTPFIVAVTVAPKPTAFVIITATLAPTAVSTLTTQLCVSAEETVNLRPSPNLTGYPISQLKNGEVVVDLGGRQGEWLYVRVGNKQGWIYSKYLEICK